MNTFPVKIVSADNVAVEYTAISLVVPAGLGYAGILANHAPFISCLKPGKIFLKTADSGPLTLELLSSGFLKVLDNAVTIVADQVKNP